MTDFVLALTTVPADFDADRLARDLVEARLAACVQVLPIMTSFYRWKGEVQSDREQQLVIKTHRARVDALWAAIQARHPYDVPEFVTVPIETGQPAYLAWLGSAVEGGQPRG